MAHREFNQNGNARELVIVDSAVSCHEDLLHGLDDSLEVIFLRGDQSGPDQLATALKGRRGVDALHIVSHGRDGALILGNAVLSGETLNQHADALLTIRSALSDVGDILLYGCEIAKTEKGESFVAALADATGANVAASRTPTGAADLGGDWDLPVHVGAVNTPVGFTTVARASFAGLLAPTIGTVNFGTGIDILRRDTNTPSTNVKASGLTVTYSGDSSTVDMVLGTVDDAFASDNSALYYGQGTVWTGNALMVGDIDNQAGGATVNYMSLKSDNGTDAFALNGFTFFFRSNSTSIPTFTATAHNASGTQIGSTATITMDNTANDGDAGSDTGYATVSDGELGSDFDNIVEFRIHSSDPTNVVIMGIDDVVIGNAVSNNAPALGGTPADDTATEDVATAIDLSTYNVSDADGDTVTLTLAVDRGTISSTDGNGTTSSVTVANSGTGSMTLQGTAANLNTYLNDASKITYTTATNDTTTAVLTVTPNDGTVNGAADTVNITISSVNDAPTLSGLPTDLVFTEDTQGSVNLSAATFADVDSASVTVTITASEGSFAAPADGAAVGGGVTETRVNATTISLAGAAADINTYLDTTNNIQWTGATNDTGDNTSTFIVTANDGNGSGDVTLGTINADIAAENDVPVFAALDGTPAFTEGGAAVTLDANVTVSDVELDALNGGNGNYSGASLTVARNGGTNTVDSFGFDTNGASFTVNGGNLQSGGNTFATFTNTGGTLTVNFTSSGATATSALVDEVVQRVAYQNTGNDLSSNPQLDYTLNDGTGTSTGSNQVTVSLTDVNDAPTLTATGGNPGYTEGGGGSDLFNTVSADTIETGQTFSAMTLTVTNVSDGASEILSFDGSDVALTNGTSVTTATNGLSVGVSVSGSTATVSFTGATLSEAQLQTVVDGLTYRNTSDNPTAGANRVVTITGITDSGGTANSGVASASLSVASTVTITPVNDPAAIGNLSGDNTGLQSGNTARIDNGGNATVSNADSADYNGGFLTIADNGANNSATGNFTVDGTNVTSGGDGTVSAGETIQVGGTTIGTVNGTADGQGGNSFTIDFTTANATDANIQTLIQNISWGGATGTGAQTFTATLNDNDGTTNGGDQDSTANFSMTLGNLPVLDLDGNDSAGTASGGFAAAFTEGGGNVAISDTDVTVTDADGGATISAITISLTNDQDGNAEGLTVSAAAQNALTGITGASDITRQDSISVTGATATLAEVQTFLQNVFYNNTSDTPDLTARTITVTVTDNDGLVSSSVTSAVSVSGVNDVPAFTGVDNAAAFTEDGTAVVLDANATVADAELDALNSGNGNYSGATLTLSRNGGANADDVFANNGQLGALTQGGNLVYNGTTVGTVTTNSGGTLLLTFNGSATSALVDSVLQNITYSNSNDTPPANVQINYAFSDGNSGTQGSGGAGSDTNDSITVTITAANDAPVFGALDGDAPSGAPNAVVDFDAGSNVTVTDPDSTDLNGGTLTISRTGTFSGNFGLKDASATSGGDGVIAAGDVIAVGGTNIGTVTTNGQGANNLVVTFNTTDATPARIQTLIQALTYQSSEAGSHGFTVTLTDGDSGTSSAATVTLSVAAPSTGGGGSTTPVVVVTQEPANNGETPNTTTTVTASTSGSGSAAIVENTNNNGNVVTATLPANTTISSTGPSTAQSKTDALTSLVNAVDARNSTAESDLIGSAQTFLNALAETTTLDVRTIIPTTTQSSLSESIVLSGTSPTAGSSQSEAFVIDLRSLPSGSNIQLDNIEFASILGTATVTGGNGDNYAVGDDSSQFIRLGEGDDQLFGGAGDDTIGSTTGNDQIFGESGHDLLFGGAGDDALNGGTNRDAALYGVASDGVTLSGTRGNVSAVDGGGTDTLTDIELVVFT
ncbi:MAG: DUF4347 domain-containing protein, partial [Nisaea sp.]